jgi:hypothetical protein
MTDQKIKQNNLFSSEATISDVSEEEQQLAAVTGGVGSSIFRASSAAKKAYRLPSPPKQASAPPQKAYPLPLPPKKAYPLPLPPK